VPLNETKCWLFPQKKEVPPLLPNETTILDAEFSGLGGRVVIKAEKNLYHTIMTGPSGVPFGQSFEIQGLSYGYYYGEALPVASFDNSAFDRWVDYDITATSMALTGQFKNGAKITLTIDVIEQYALY